MESPVSSFRSRRTLNDVKIQVLEPSSGEEGESPDLENKKKQVKKIADDQSKEAENHLTIPGNNKESAPRLRRNNKRKSIAAMQERERLALQAFTAQFSQQNNEDYGDVKLDSACKNPNNHSVLYPPVSYQHLIYNNYSLQPAERAIDHPVKHPKPQLAYNQILTRGGQVL